MLKKMIGIVIYATILAGCAPFSPSNYLRPATIQSSQNGHWNRPTLIPLNSQTLQTTLGKRLLAPLINPKPYQVGAYDNLNIIVWGHPDMSTLPTSPAAQLSSALVKPGVANPAINVDAHGDIFYPYVGTLHVAGLTVNQVQRSITQRLSSYIRDPQVTVQIVEYRNRNIYVLGEVKLPGSQPLTDKPLTLMGAITKAGDINPEQADPKHIYLIRGSYECPYIFWLNAMSPQALLLATHLTLQENDIVYVSAAVMTEWGRFLNQVFPSMQASIVSKTLI
ncbi:MAG: polysaccharide biosynthesis/export family protein [Legionella sp.]|nr:polysaccharide biosynthesis/export family protein [Legionella sp.]